ncbi:MAG: glycosyltransferase [Proteobacteria bacterium]|jgi:undecaprenyl-phosphate 4-deoxy-4-formamido-L-arabinose transferase|nr:glycosyltransferase [Pseudomonadota bacterium]
MTTAPDQHKPELDVSIVIPVYNEEAVLPQLFERLYPVLDSLERSYEVIFVDDGSRDHSAALLRKQYQARPDVTRVVCLRANAGQHAAILAGFEYTGGKAVITLDADLQNPPEEIVKLLAELDKGYDYVGTIRRKRRDSSWRHLASRAMNKLRERITNIHMTDQGCMLRAYDHDIISAILDSREAQTFIPALAYLYAGNPTEIVVEHEERAAGESKYHLFKLIHLNFDLMTGFSLMPLQVFSLVGIGIAIISFVFVIYLAVRRLIVGPEVEGVFTLFAIVFFLIGILLFGIGLLGEYVGRIYVQARGRPRFLIKAVLDKRTADKPDQPE